MAYFMRLLPERGAIGDTSHGSCEARQGNRDGIGTDLSPHPAGQGPGGASEPTGNTQALIGSRKDFRACPG